MYWPRSQQGRENDTAPHTAWHWPACAGCEGERKRELSPPGATVPNTTAGTVPALPAQGLREGSAYHKPHTCTVKSLFKQDKYFQKDGIMLCRISTDSVLTKRGTKIQVALNHHGRWTSLFISARSNWFMQQRESFSQETCLECLKPSLKSTHLWWQCIFWINFSL